MMFVDSNNSTKRRVDRLASPGPRLKILDKIKEIKYRSTQRLCYTVLKNYLTQLVVVE
jgi:hypothetical protein